MAARLHTELIARTIADARLGEVRTVAEVREAVFAEALKQIRIVRNEGDPEDRFYDGPDQH